MSKVRVYEIAKQLGLSNKELLNTLKEFDIEVKNHMSSLTDEEASIVTEYYAPSNGENNKEVVDTNKETMEIEDDNEDLDVISIPTNVTVKDLAERLGKQSSDIVKSLMLKGIMATANQEIDYETASSVALEFDFLTEEEEEKDIVDEFFAEEPDDEEDLVTRSPIVVVMGHVDHGKTSLLDAIRESNVTSREAGGITQHIGASVVTINDNDITFLDTPGHEAFTAMRLRGAMATDIAILVVAADDGVMPQTVEAINHAKAANVQIIVAINKIDKPGANQDRVKQELVEYGLVAEDWGGDTICVPVSAIEKTGLDQLLEMILLVSEMEELKANPNKKASGTIVEAQLDKGRGPVATVLIQNGTLKVGDAIIAGTSYGKIRAMIDDKGRRVKQAGPSTPVEILGLSEVPVAGDAFYTAKNEREARHVAEKVIRRDREKLIQNTPQKVTLDDLFSQIQAGNMKELNIVVKADVQGSVEAVKQSLVKLSNEEVMIKVIHGGVGAINESDVMLASASNAIIIGFNVRPEASAKTVAESEQIDIRLYRVIYNAIEDIEAAMKGMLDPEYREKVIGHAEVRQTFKVSSVGTIAGSYVQDGKFTRNAKVRLVRDGIVIYEGELESLKRFKDDVKEVNSGYECGIMLSKFNDLKEGDIVEAYIMEEIPR
ncbi:translation initiation factor IF-2 [Vallitalea guaymasensis]|uniref:Translation initiation factor IF-2 n=1 Tax=Vallitalea guaymasensis TaxID=1185412 RepID=A0A8J8MF66_9FIRM|nr:translation initiation factor IF-2 [Vallitalea guaymasensis]QUH31862.1 translation initiation factor IF-2 [Vallitalea guaymasensis]